MRWSFRAFGFRGNIAVSRGLVICLLFSIMAKVLRVNATGFRPGLALGFEARGFERAATARNWLIAASICLNIATTVLITSNQHTVLITTHCDYGHCCSGSEP